MDPNGHLLAVEALADEDVFELNVDRLVVRHLGNEGLAFEQAFNPWQMHLTPSDPFFVRLKSPLLHGLEVWDERRGGLSGDRLAVGLEPVLLCVRAAVRAREVGLIDRGQGNFSCHLSSSLAPLARPSSLWYAIARASRKQQFTYVRSWPTCDAHGGQAQRRMPHRRESSPLASSRSASHRESSARTRLR